MARLQCLLAAVLCGRVQTHAQKKSQPITFEIVGFDACLFRAREWDELDAVYTAGVAALVGLSKDKIKDVEGQSGHVSIAARNFTLQVPVPGHTVSFFIDGQADVKGLWAMDFHDSVMKIIAPSPPELNRLALAQRTLHACDSDGDGELSFEEFEKVLKQHHLSGLHAKGEEHWANHLAKYGGPVGLLANLPGYTLPTLACQLGVAEKPAAEAIECGALDRLYLGAEGRIMVSKPETFITKLADTEDQVYALKTNSKTCHPFDWQSLGLHNVDLRGERKFSIQHQPTASLAAKAKRYPEAILAGVSVLGSVLVVAAMVARSRPRAYHARHPRAAATAQDTVKFELLA